MFQRLLWHKFRAVACINMIGISKYVEIPFNYLKHNILLIFLKIHLDNIEPFPFFCKKNEWIFTEWLPASVFEAKKPHV